ncbi:MAG TPA: type IV toxin-antitoxin system AbiEi family antitoxin domain-containing protein [Longimicrobiales bacterium]
MHDDGERKDHPDRVIDGIAARQHGVILRKQMAAAGVGRGAIDRRIAIGRLHPLHRGVFRVGPVVSPHARTMAAVLACGTHAVLSHRSAGALWGLLPAASGGALEVTLPRDVRRRVPGVVAHRTCVLGVDDITVCDGIPVTTPVRTLLDLGLVLPSHELERAIATADRVGMVRMEDLTTRVNGLSSRAVRLADMYRGAARIRTLLQLHGAALTRSEAEARLLSLIRRARLPRPRVNATMLGYEVDFLWEEQRLVVEVDGFAYHSSEKAFARDRRRDAELTTAGYNVVRFTWDDLSRHPEATLVMLAQALLRPQAASVNGRRA